MKFFPNGLGKSMDRCSLGRPKEDGNRRVKGNSIHDRE